ncbi:TLG2-vesicle protein of 38 kDa [Moelleriella libera RCEF 2490]|uniref:Golgi apparatus membrane protein TVP38 n=1 Tax=Moelleriella libera RCEF 2490 TaxID=1081109 RepID=A0A166VKB4_9HYPO|nr:TLG2-vesicle protein of 38 kDa [Moelleriella libera RCEF 2490]
MGAATSDGPGRSSPPLAAASASASSSSSSSSSPSSARISPSSPSPEPPAVRWSRRVSPIRRLSETPTTTRRRYSRHPSDYASSSSSSPVSSFVQGLWRSAHTWSQWLLRTYLNLPPAYKLLAAVVAAAGLVLAVLSLVYSHRFIAWLVRITRSWRELPGGWLIVLGLIFVTAFPPLIGYSTANTIAGIVYGFPLGWPVVAVGCVLGSLCAFLASRTVLSGYVDRMVGRDHRFVALGQVLRKDGLLYLTAIRFCPLPFSLSNGFLATIPSISPLAFALSTAFSTARGSPNRPKLLIHVFIGSRLAILAEQGNNMTAGDKAINYIAMAVGGAIGLAVGLVIYRRTMARAAELARRGEAAADAAERGQQQQRLAVDGYDDDNDATTTLLDPEDAAAAIMMSDDDVSLWEASGTATSDNMTWDAYNDVDDDDDDDDENDADASRAPSGGRKGHSATLSS